MKIQNLVCSVALLTLLVGCASSPPTRYFTLSDGDAGALPQGLTPSIVITQTTLPELIDRPQLIIRQSDNLVIVDELQRWAEPLRRDIPRVVANELGRQLSSSRVLSLPIDGQNFDADYRLLIDVQRLEAIVGQGAQVDIMWRLISRQGKLITGRSNLRESIATHDTESLVSAQRRLLKAVAVEIAKSLKPLIADKS